MIEFYSILTEVFILSCAEVGGQHQMLSPFTLFEAASLVECCIGQASWSSQPSGESPISVPVL